MFLPLWRKSLWPAIKERGLRLESCHMLWGGGFSLSVCTTRFSPPHILIDLQVKSLRLRCKTLTSPGCQPALHSSDFRLTFYLYHLNLTGSILVVFWGCTLVFTQDVEDGTCKQWLTIWCKIFFIEIHSSLWYLWLRVAHICCLTTCALKQMPSFWKRSVFVCVCVCPLMQTHI